MDSMSNLERVQVLKGADSKTQLPLVRSGGTATAVVFPAVGAKHRSMHVIRLDPEGRTVELRHPSESGYYVRSGTASVSDSANDERQELVEGSMVHVDPHTPHTFTAGDLGCEILGGPCPPDPAVYNSLTED